MTVVRNEVVGEMVQKSLVKELRTVFTDVLGGVWIATQDFNHDKHWNGTTRTLPYIYVEYTAENKFPYHIGNRKVQFDMLLNVGVACTGHDQQRLLPGQVQQYFDTVDDGTTNVPGRIRLWDFGTAPETLVGYFEVMLNGNIIPLRDISPGARSEGKELWTNLKYTSIIPILVQVIKTRENRLL